MNNDRWKVLVSESEATIEKYLTPAIDIDLATLIRCATFRVFVVGFLGLDRDRFAFANVQLVTGALSEFYQGQSALSPEVEGILYEWLPQQQFPSSLDRILPAYEVIWRLVAMLVVTCMEEKEGKPLRWVMMDFRDNPQDRQYRTCLDANGKSVSAITNDAVDHLKRITRLPSVTISNWPLGCIQNATTGRPTAQQPPTEHEALKSAALMAAIIIGLIGVHYGLSGGAPSSPQAAPWDERRIFGMRGGTQGSLGHVAINVLPQASTSNQAY